MSAVKTCGAFVLVAVVAMAVAGVGTASGSSLCKELKNPCPEPQIYKLETQIEEKLEAGTSMEFAGEGTFGVVKCTVASMQFKITKNEGPEKVMRGQVTSMLVEKCNTCGTAKALNLPYAAEVIWNPVTEGDGFLTVSNGGKGVPSIKFENCNLGISCTYGAKSLVFGIEGGNPATLDTKMEGLSYENGSVLCSEKAPLTVSYTITGPKPLFVMSKP
jgi:hypothetical protein